jgi:hypothetical protein
MVALFNTPTERLNTMGLYAYERVVSRHDIDTEANKLTALFTDGDMVKVKP